MLFKALYKGVVHHRMRCNGMPFLQAVLYELNMMLNVMGVELYVKYLNGTAVEGVDFITLE